METLPGEFYLQDTIAVARALLGKTLVRVLPTGEYLSGVIVETEAYLTGDPASHTYRGLTPRNQVMFGPPGHAYVYVNYGLHMMLNAVCGPVGVGEAVLIRALDPVEGIATMRKNRGGIESVLQLTNGPGKLAQALHIKKETDNGADLTDPQGFLKICSGSFCPKDEEIVAATRIGITKGADSLWRFYLKGCPFVSRR